MQPEGPPGGTEGELGGLSGEDSRGVELAGDNSQTWEAHGKVYITNSSSHEVLVWMRGVRKVFRTRSWLVNFIMFWTELWVFCFPVGLARH